MSENRLKSPLLAIFKIHQRVLYTVNSSKRHMDLMRIYSRLFILICSFGLLMTNCRAENWPSAIPPYDIGISKSSQKELQDQYEELKTKAYKSPSNSQNMLELALVESDLGNLDEAIKHARTVTLNKPDYWQGHAILGKLFLLDRNTLGARLQSERALELTKDPKYRGQILATLLPALIELKQPIQADKVSKSELKKNPKDAFLTFCRAWVQANLPLPASQMAGDTYRKALELEPGLAESHYNLALLLARGNDRQKAKKELQSFAQRSKSPQEAKLAEDLMSKLDGQD